MNRRDFITSGSIVAAMASAGTILPADGNAEPARPENGGKAPAVGKTMPMSLSAIITEGERTSVSVKNTSTFEEFIELARDTGYDAVNMRASLAGIATPVGRLHQMAGQVKSLGLSVSSVSPDFSVPINNEHAPDGLRDITPYLDVASIFGAGMIRVGMKTEADIPWAQRAADEAAERNIKLAHHAESNTMCENFELTLATMKAVNRPNFGLMYDEAQWLANTPDYSEARIVEQIKTIAPWICNVFIKNNPGGPGPMSRPNIRLEASGGVNFDKLFEGLYAIRYRGWLTVHEKAEPYGNDVKLAATKCREFLQAYADRATY
jgi:sugar phosphate isomerase/epimerase